MFQVEEEVKYRAEGSGGASEGQKQQQSSPHMGGVGLQSWGHRGAADVWQTAATQSEKKDKKNAYKIILQSNQMCSERVAQNYNVLNDHFLEISRVTFPLSDNKQTLRQFVGDWLMGDFWCQCQYWYKGAWKFWYLIYRWILCKYTILDEFYHQIVVTEICNGGRISYILTATI